MIQRRDFEGDGWAPSGAAPVVATNLQMLLEDLVRRYGLKGAVVATRAGDVRASVGAQSLDTGDGFGAAVAGDAEVLQGLAHAIDGMTLPRFFSQGSLDAYADLPTADTVALFMRDPGTAGGERSDLEMVSDYNVAKELVMELRAGMARLGDAG